MSAQLALENSLEKGLHFFVLASGQKFHAAIVEVADGTGHVETFRDVPHRPAKAYALDITFVKNLNGCRHASED
jgi:hypothetical protein